MGMKRLLRHNRFVFGKISTEARPLRALEASHAWSF